MYCQIYKTDLQFRAIRDFFSDARVGDGGSWSKGFLGFFLILEFYCLFSKNSVVCNKLNCVSRYIFLSNEYKT